MDTCNKISKYMQKVGYECRVMGVPKTIDNDLFGTDHCPGFASAAKYIATSCAEVWQDGASSREVMPFVPLRKMTAKSSASERASAPFS